jgi:hypothetical protein
MPRHLPSEGEIQRRSPGPGSMHQMGRALALAAPACSAFHGAAIKRMASWAVDNVPEETYSNRTRGYRKQHGLLANAEAPAPVPGTDHRARLIRQVYEVNPQLCPRCGGTMKVIAVIERACARHLSAWDTHRRAADRRPSRP